MLYQDFLLENDIEYDNYMQSANRIESEQRKKVLPLLSIELGEMFSQGFMHDCYIKSVKLKRFMRVNRLPQIKLSIYGESIKGALIYKDVIRYEHNDTFIDKVFRSECLLDELYLDDEGRIVHNMLLHPKGIISITAKTIEWCS